jgi:hypothetical protein
MIASEAYPDLVGTYRKALTLTLMELALPRSKNYVLLKQYELLNSPKQATWFDSGILL